MSGRAPALLIHGTAPAAWGELPVLLADAGHRALAYDRRGFGTSDVARATSLTEHAYDAAAELERLGTPAVVVGWSIGGVVALEVAACRPELVAGLVLLEPPLHAKRHPTPSMLGALAGAILLGRAGRHERAARRFLRWALGRRSGGCDLDRMPSEWHARLAAGDAAAVTHELGLGTGEHLSTGTLASIDCPVTVLAGTDSAPPFAAAAGRIGRLVAQAEVVAVEGSGHAVQLDAPARVVAAVSAMGSPDGSPRHGAASRGPMAQAVG